MKITVKATPKTYAQQAASVLSRLPDMAGNHPQPAKAARTMGAKAGGDVVGEMAKLQAQLQQMSDALKPKPKPQAKREQPKSYSSLRDGRSSFTKKQSR